MDQRFSKIFNKDKYNDIVKYCELNEIDNIDEFILVTFNEGFNIRKYGLLNKNQKPIEVPVEVIKYVDREVPVEVIKYVDREVPVEVVKYVDREVPVEKIVITESEPIIREVIIEKENDDKIKMLTETLHKLREELMLKNKKIEELENFGGSRNVTYLNGSKIN